MRNSEIENHAVWCRVLRNRHSFKLSRKIKKDSREQKNIFPEECNASVTHRDDRHAKTEFRYPSDKDGAQRGKYLRRPGIRRFVRVERTILQRLRKSGIQDHRVARIAFD